jgi:hypothetical protein
MSTFLPDKRLFIAEITYRVVLFLLLLIFGCWLFLMLFPIEAWLGVPGSLCVFFGLIFARKGWFLWADWRNSAFRQLDGIVLSFQPSRSWYTGTKGDYFLTVKDTQGTIHIFRTTKDWKLSEGASCRLWVGQRSNVLFGID